MNAKTCLQKITVIPYDPVWPVLFFEEAVKIKSTLGKLCEGIHHVGSTAVPGLAAKPKIDILAKVEDLKFNHSLLENLGYNYRGGFNLPLRKSFTVRSPDLNVNLHVFEKNDPEIELNLLFRDYLRNHAEAREQYADLKAALLQEEASHAHSGMYRGYTLGKHDFIQDILKKAGFNRQRFVIATHAQEWKAVQHFRNTYFFAPHSIEDPYTWTFDRKDHKHLLFYQGVEIVGYAHIQLWPNNRAALRMIAIDKKLQGENYGQAFMDLTEKWLRLDGYKSLHTESSPTALGFYRRLGYKDMPFEDPDGYEGSAEDTEMGKML
jgi:GrpB-like predicted nucleotidyltransferase (UPF0157 family)